VTNFTTKYYADTLPSVHNPTPRYNVDENESKLSLFRGQLGRASAVTHKNLQHEEWRTIMMYVLKNHSYSEFTYQFWRRIKEPTP
jgi:hypothetical protein